MAKPVIKLYCLPRLSQKKLQKIHKKIVSAAKIVFKDFGKINNETDLIVLFIPDSMKYGPGMEILVEIDLPINEAYHHHASDYPSAFGNKIRKLFPKAVVQCTLRHIDPSNTWDWDSV
jgi:hypothetical protein